MAYGPAYGGYAYPPAAPPPPPPPPPMRPRAPLAVHIVAVLLYLTGLVLVVSGLVAIGALALGTGWIDDLDLPPSVRGELTGLALPVAALAVVLGLLAVVIGRRVHRGRQWARVLVLVLSVLSLAGNVYSLITTGLADPLSGLVLPVLYLVLLNTGTARAYFRHRLPY